MTADAVTREILLTAVLMAPGRLAELTEREWDAVLPAARVASLLPRLAMLTEDLGIDGELPDAVRDSLCAAKTLGQSHERSVKWELTRIAAALKPLNQPVVLLKGAAYVAAEMPLARGRLVSDVDIMVPYHALDAVERALRSAGWDYDKLDPYDQQYYRRWMHELPPLHHKGRRTVVDVHHTILPLTSRLRPDPEELWRAARPLDLAPYRVFAPADMILHSTAHLFQDGDLNTQLRNLVDIHDMLNLFALDREFWPYLTSRAEQLDLSKPLYYALRYCERILGTAVPDAATSAVAAAAPARLIRSIMDHMVPRALLPDGNGTAGVSRNSALTMLYIRSHWLRMPPLLLTRHLIRKALVRAGERRKNR